MTEHEEAVATISKEFKRRGFRVHTRLNNLPTDATRSEAVYRPDILVRNPKDRQIVWIVEVETSEAGKAVVGAAALADICMEKEIAKGPQKVKPKLLFVFYRTSANLELAVKRLIALRSKITHFSEIAALTEREAFLKISQLPTDGNWTRHY